MKKLLLTTLLFMTACATAIQNPTVKLKNVQLAGLDGKGASLNFLLTINNPNIFDLPLQGYTYDVRLLELPLAGGESKECPTLPAKSTAEMLIPVRISFTDIREIIKRTPGLRDIPYRLQADLSMGTPFGTITVPVSKNGFVSIPQQYQPANLQKKIGDFLNNRKW